MKYSIVFSLTSPNSLKNHILPVGYCITGPIWLDSFYAEVDTTTDSKRKFILFFHFFVEFESVLFTLC